MQEISEEQHKVLEDLGLGSMCEAKTTYLFKGNAVLKLIKKATTTPRKYNYEFAPGAKLLYKVMEARHGTKLKSGSLVQQAYTAMHHFAGTGGDNWASRDHMIQVVADNTPMSKTQAANTLCQLSTRGLLERRPLPV
jgi:hypothetical protein